MEKMNKWLVSSLFAVSFTALPLTYSGLQAMESNSTSSVIINQPSSVSVIGTPVRGNINKLYDFFGDGIVSHDTLPYKNAYYNDKVYKENALPYRTSYYTTPSGGYYGGDSFSHRGGYHSYWNSHDLHHGYHGWHGWHGHNGWHDGHHYWNSHGGHHDNHHHAHDDYHGHHGHHEGGHHHEHSHHGGHHGGHHK